MTQKKKKRLIIVLGMHRSGTSAITRGLNALGVELGNHLVPPQSANEAGFWEDIDLNTFDNELLDFLGYDWHTLTPIQPTDLARPDLEDYKLRATKLLRKRLRSFPVFGMKDPRVTILLPFWKTIFDKVGAEISYVIAVRHPMSVARSLNKQFNFEPEKSYYLWLEHMVSCLLYSSNNPRVVVDFDRLMEHPEKQLCRIAEALDLPFTEGISVVTEYTTEFLRDDLRHTQFQLDDLIKDPSAPQEVIRTCELLTDLSNDRLATNASKVHSFFQTLEEHLDTMRPALTYMTKQDRTVAERNLQIEQLSQTVVNRDEQATERNQDIAERDGQIKGLGQVIANRDSEIEERDEHIEGLSQVIADQDSKIAGLSQTVVERDQIVASHDLQIRDLNQAVITCDGEIADRDSEIEERDGLIQGLRQGVADRDNEIAKLNQTLINRNESAAEQDLQIEAFTQALINRNRKIAGLNQNITERDGQIKDLHQTVADKDGQIAKLDQAAVKRDLALVRHNAQIIELHQKIAERDDRIDEIKHRLLEVQALLDSILISPSWKITEPLRWFRLNLITAPLEWLRKTLEKWVQKAWHQSNWPVDKKEKIKAIVFGNLPTLLGSTEAYKFWKRVHAPTEQRKAPASIATKTHQPTPPKAKGYVSLLQAEPIKEKSAKLICFYLPQFHAIPENNNWWGNGFTEWTNVKPTKPQFEGHYQPRIPGELGYYDLTNPAVQKRQTELAQLYGIEGFCFYFYWFAGTCLLETPTKNYLENSELDLPFCLCWANENWSRAWDGLDQEILIAQDHSPEDDLAFIQHVAKYMRDPRYIRINGKPLLLVYRPNLLPSAKETAERWRSWCRENDLGEIYLAYTQSFEKADPKKYGFDAAIEFPPNNSAPPNITDSVAPLHDDFNGVVYDWNIFLERSQNYKPQSYKLFRSVCPSWDNTARRQDSGTVFLNSSPEKYQQWLTHAISETKRSFKNPEERLVFINAWNEWAEGAYLEPDQKYGYAYLQATRNALVETIDCNKPSLLIVTHDCHPHGAQFLILETARQIKAFGYHVSILALAGGPLLNDFKEVASVLNAEVAGDNELDEFLSALQIKGAKYAITSTVVCGQILPKLKQYKFEVLSLIHELPGVLQNMKQQGNAKLISLHSNVIVFPAEMVRQGFCDFSETAIKKTIIRPQGVLRKNPYKGNKEEAHEIVCKKHNLPASSRIILNIAFIDHRKGPDLFVDIAERVLENHPNAVFIWVGHPDPETEKKVLTQINKRGLEKKVLFVGYDRDPMAYYAAATAYALTSREDPFPNVVLESAEVGVPIVAFEGASGAGNFIIEQNGRLATNLDTKDFAKHIGELLNNPPPPSQHPVGSLRQYTLDLLHHLTGLPRISVVVPNYNYEMHIEARLKSICSQTVPIYELVVLDDASSDQSADLIEKVLTKTEIDSRLIVNEQNSGSVFRQWKKGLNKTKGELLWIAEADDLAKPNFLESLIPAFNDPKVVMAYSQSQPIDENDTPLSENYLAYTTELSDAWEHDYVREGREEIREAHCIKNPALNVSSVLFRRNSLKKAFRKAGSSLFQLQVAGDWLIYLHVLTQGKVSFCAEALNLHRRHTNNVTNSTAKTRHYDEVCQLQNEAAKLAPPSKEVKAKVTQYRKTLREQFQLPEETEKS